MVTLIGNIHFWSHELDVLVKDADVGAFRYQDKGVINKERCYYNLRKKYIESRGGTVILKNGRPNKLRDSLKELEEILTKEKVISENWTSALTYQIFFSSGLIVFLTMNPSNGDVANIVFDKFLQGKLLSENITDAVQSSNYLIFAYNDFRVTLVHITKPLSMLDGKIPCRVSSQEPKISSCEGIGPPGRRFERKLSINASEDLLLVWWKTDDDEVYPWTPINSDKDRSNLLVYNLSGSNLDLLCYCRTEMPPLSVDFSKTQDNIILTVEQGFDKVGGVTVLSCVYEIERNALQRVSVTSIPLDAPLTAHSHNPSESRLLLACNNGVLALHCESRGMTHVTKAGLIPSFISWMDNGTLVIVSNERGQLQCFDLALSLIRVQLSLEDMNPQRILDFSDYFCYQQLLQGIHWAPPVIHKESSLISPIMLHFKRGPLACLNIYCGETFNNIKNCGRNSLKAEGSSNGNASDFSPSLLVKQYIKHKQFDEAINLLVSLSWEYEGSVALQCLCTIISALLKLPLNSQRESQIEAALSSFLVPVVQLSSAVEEEFGPPVRAATRRFFFKVVRKGNLEKAYRLALDLNDHDCFLTVHHVARLHGNRNLASLSLQSARELNSDSCWSGSCSSFLCSDSNASSDDESCSQTCSESCSTCSSDSDIGKKKVLSDINEEPASDNPKSGEEMSANSDFESVHSYHNTPGTSSAVQESQDGTITINIRQQTPAQGVTHRVTTFNKMRQYQHPQGRLKTVKEVSEASDSNEELVNEENSLFYAQSESLKAQYNAAFQEITTEEEDGSTVKVVHFGVV